MRFKNKKIYLLVFLILIQSMHLKADKKDNGLKNWIMYGALIVSGYILFQEIFNGNIIFISNSNLSFGSKLNLEKEESCKEYNLDTALTALKIKNFSGKVSVEGTDSNTLKVQSTKFFRSGESDKVVVHEPQFDENSIEVRTENVSSSFIKNEYVNLVLQIPRHLSVVIETCNGRVEVKNIQNVVAATSNGAITVDNADNVNLKTSNGSISATNIKNSVFAKTSNGEIIALLTGIINKVDLCTSNGSVTLTLPKTYSGYVFAKTSNRKVISQFPQFPNDIVNVKTSNGKIEIKKAH